MGQLLLGFRSLIIKVAIFVVLAALLAWVLGGTLWPRPHIVEYDTVRTGDLTVWWQMRVGGGIDGPPHWRLMMRPDGGEQQYFSTGRTGNQAEAAEPVQFAAIAGPVVLGDRVAFAGRKPNDPARPTEAVWAIYILDGRTLAYERHAMPDRLAVEQQLVRLASGLPLQSESVIREQRARVLDPTSGRADEQSGPERDDAE